MDDVTADVSAPGGDGASSSGRFRWTIAQTRHGESIDARRSRNRISGIFLGSGALLAFSALLLIPGWQVANKPVLAIVGTCVILGSITQVVFAAYVPIPMNHITSVVGTAAIASAQVLAGFPVAIATVGFLYVWVAVFTAVFYRPAATAVHIVVMSVVQVAVLLYLGDMVLLPQVVVTIGTCITAAMITSWITGDLRRQVAIDPLTLLPNRRGLELAFQRSITATRRRTVPTAVIVVDIDDFKSVNDRAGHAAGDRALVDCAAAWRKTLRPTDTLARVGGDEFVAVVPGGDLAAGRAAGRRLQEATPAGITCSVGVAATTLHEPLSSLLDRADSEMYREKIGKGLSADGRQLTAPAPPPDR